MDGDYEDICEDGHEDWDEDTGSEGSGVASDEEWEGVDPRPIDPPEDSGDTHVRRAASCPRGRCRSIHKAEPTPRRRAHSCFAGCAEQAEQAWMRAGPLCRRPEGPEGDIARLVACMSIQATPSRLWAVAGLGSPEVEGTLDYELYELRMAWLDARLNRSLITTSELSNKIYEELIMRQLPPPDGNGRPAVRRTLDWAWTRREDLRHVEPWRVRKELDQRADEEEQNVTLGWNLQGPVFPAATAGARAAVDAIIQALQDGRFTAPCAGRDDETARRRDIEDDIMAASARASKQARRMRAQERKEEKMGPRVGDKRPLEGGKGAPHRPNKKAKRGDGDTTERGGKRPRPPERVDHKGDFKRKR